MSKIQIEYFSSTELPSPDALLISFAFDRKPGDIAYVKDPSQTRLVVSLGESSSPTPESCRVAGGSLANLLLKEAASEALLLLDSLGEANTPVAREAILTGLLIGGFRFEPYKTLSSTSPAIVYVTGEVPGLVNEVNRISATCEAQNLARAWAHEPPNVINPLSLVDRAITFANQLSLDIQIFDDQQLTNLGAHALVAVGKGSQTPSRMIVLKYRGNGEGHPVVIVGKAITFDTGGYSIKTNEGMLTMKYDKSGAMTVFGVLQAAATLKLSTPIIGIIAAAENMIAGNAYRPSDILKTLSGKTVEIISTDAEGRLVLADALTYACQFLQPRAIIDLATLTGGVVVALGKLRAGVMGNDPALLEALQLAGDATGERLWPLPLDDEYLELIKGDDSDFKNSSGKPVASAIVGGIFLKQFITTEVPWAHLDIAGVAHMETNHPYFARGGTGFGVRLLTKYLENLQ